MVAEPLFTPVSFVREDQEEIQYLGGSLILYGPNGVGKSYLLEAIASSLQGEVVGRAEPGSLIPEEEGLLGVIAHLADGVNPDDIELLQPPPGQYPYNQMDKLRQAVEASRSHYASVVEDAEVVGAVGAVLDEFASLRLAFLVPLDAPFGPGWRLHAVARGLGLEARGFDPLPVGGDDLWTFTSPEDFERVTGYRFNGHKPHVHEQEGLGQTVFGRVIDDSRVDVSAITRTWLKDRSSPRWVDGVEVEGETLTAEWVDRANQLLRTFLADPPELSFGFGGSASWLAEGAQPWLGIDGLGFAERRWAQVAIALTAETDDTPYLIVDEPERGMHRTAEAHLAEGLRALVSSGRVRMIAATHSPEFIDTDFGQLIHLERTESARWGSLRELTHEEVDDLRSFGLQPTSLLSRDRGYLLVEGEHDKQILEGYFSDDLRATRVKVLAMRGTDNIMSIFDSEFLIDGTDALLMPLLDDIPTSPLVAAWTAAEAATLDKRRSDAVGVLRRGLAVIPGEAKYVYERVLVGAIARGIGPRFLPLGMSKKDVLEYLPVTEVVPEAESWESLRKEWHEWRKSSKSPAAADMTGKAYKRWLRKAKGADLSPENLRWIAETTSPHPELKTINALVGEHLDPRAPRSR